MVIPINENKEKPSLDPIPLDELLLDSNLVNELRELCMENSHDIWVLSLGDMSSPCPTFSELLQRISRDFDTQWGAMENSQYTDEILLSADIPSLMLTQDHLFSETGRLILRIRSSRDNVICWEISLASYYISQNSSYNWDCQSWDWSSKNTIKEFCSYFLNRNCNSISRIHVWSEPPVNNWQDLLPKCSIEIFNNWLYSTGLSHRNRRIFQDRMGLISGHIKTLEEIGQEYNLTRERVRQITDKSLNRLSHHVRRKRLAPFHSQLQKLFRRYGGIMTVSEIANNQSFLTDFGHYASMPVIALILYYCDSFSAFEDEYKSARGSSDIGSVTWHLNSIDPNFIRRSRKLALEIIDTDQCSYNFEELVEKVSTESDILINNITNITRAALRTFALIEYDTTGLIMKTGKVYISIPNMALIVLREIGVPAHYSQIAKMINDRFIERNVKPHDVHTRLYSPLFRWVDRGTYGLAEWGLPEIKPKESYKAQKRLIKAALKQMGRPATIKEIDEYLEKIIGNDPNYILLSKTNIALINNPRIFINIGDGKWALKEWNIAPRKTKYTMILVCEILAEETTEWLTFNQLVTELKSRGWSGSIGYLQNNIWKELSKPNRRIRKEELHGFNVQLYGLSSCEWNQDAVLNMFLNE